MSVPLSFTLRPGVELVLSFLSPSSPFTGCLHFNPQSEADIGNSASSLHPPQPTSMSSTRPYDVKKQPWSTGLCGCFEDIRSCFITFWCPCITFGWTSEIVERGNK
ncbi:hypothetical protein BT93_G1365 [Corymbia citriodora subsp. variegata]|nr:hypothetical protein BT93_G1365 [Corymbia citriodora subsp. variegata]